MKRSIIGIIACFFYVGYAHEMKDENSMVTLQQNIQALEAATIALEQRLTILEQQYERCVQILQSLEQEEQNYNRFDTNNN